MAIVADTPVETTHAQDQIIAREAVAEAEAALSAQVLAAAMSKGVMPKPTPKPKVHDYPPKLPKGWSMHIADDGVTP